jgi:RNA polymerase sigma-70 factor (ECF subfamily)
MTSREPSSEAMNGRSTVVPCPDFARIVRENAPDRSLFEQIVDCFSGQLARFARDHCRDESLGQDAFQEAMITAFTKLDSFRGDSPIVPWLRRIVISACSRLRRGKKNDPSVNLPFDPERGDGAVESPFGDQELQLMIAQSLEMVRAELERLDETNRSLFEAHDIDEVPIAELAERFEMSAEAVKSRLKRARAQVREGLLESLLG